MIDVKSLSSKKVAKLDVHFIRLIFTSFKRVALNGKYCIICVHRGTNTIHVIADKYRSALYV